MERTIFPAHRSHGDAHIKGEAEGGDHQNHFRDRDFQIPEIDDECSAEKKERKLQHDGHGLHDQAQSPLLESHELDLAFLPSINNIPPGRDPSVVQDPLLPQHGDEGHEQCKRQTGEEDGLNSDDSGWDVRDRCQGISSTK